MSDGISKLRRDLTILEAMAAEMPTYLDYDALFWPLSDSSMPRLTLGGYLMRQHRLKALANLLTDSEQGRLDQAMLAFREGLVDRIVRFETKGHQEAGMFSVDERVGLCILGFVEVDPG